MWGIFLTEKSLDLNPCFSEQPNYKNYGCSLEIVTDRSQEGAQFVKGFGGVGGKIFQLFTQTYTKI